MRGIFVRHGDAMRTLSSCLSLYLNILVSMYMCLSVVWECVFDSDKKRETVQVQGNSWYQSVETLSLSLSLSPALSLSLSLSCLIFCLYVSLLRQCVLSSDFETPR
jgi:hypothetical protein